VRSRCLCFLRRAPCSRQRSSGQSTHANKYRVSRNGACHHHCFYRSRRCIESSKTFAVTKHWLASRKASLT
jgi:hypothetical protein